ncbi:MAG: hypothetical protein ABSH47_05500 [Bryobacteraceae bacterium]|jgi:hypothetical protein
MPRRSVLLLLMMLAVTAQAADMAGHYYLQHVMEVGSELLLKPDGTFEFGLAYGAADYYAKGKWRTEGGSVILNSTDKEEPPFRLTRSAATKSPGTRVWVLAPDGQPAAHIDVVIDTAGGKSAAKTSDEGVAEFPDKTGARSAFLRIAVYQVQAGPFALNPAHNDFYFEINGDAITRVPFKDERLAIDGAALVMTHYGADHPMRYEKQ